MDKFKVLKWGSLPVIVELQNGVKKYGSFMGFKPEPIGIMEHWLFLPNLIRQEYNKTNDKNLLITISHTDINGIEPQIDIPK